MTSQATLDRFECDQLHVTPWKNGGGSTREIACWPPGAGLSDFGWRVSIATIAASGPFSVFQGIDRHIMLLEGDGVRLQSSEGHIDHLLDRPHTPFAFSGDATIGCTLLGGASSDFNVMTRRGQWRAELQVFDRTAVIAPAPHGILLALRRSWQLDQNLDHGPLIFREGEGLHWSGAPPAWQALRQTPDALLILVRFIPTPSQTN
jgi:environmental stress-induced protein Ves